ncbi:prostate and testis expressed protein 3 isoform X2 [Fukomys damarensis]|uniref:prostate and testis expressed protein 3 isoform X2 n=1 Tax=Fukomys damarensis TaxID=885580 RepID=UPI001455753A|nr:prostate and testis expressed protein 3 isoform X2 [Fukomys damarensis]
MNKHFLFLFSLFCVIVAASLKCITCQLHMVGERCRRGFGTCIAQKDETCMNLKIFRNNVLQLSYMVCQKFCKNGRYKINDRLYYYRCCSSNYCNKEV